MCDGLKGGGGWRGLCEKKINLHFDRNKILISSDFRIGTDLAIIRIFNVVNLVSFMGTPIDYLMK